MNWSILTQLFAALFVSIVASIVVLRCGTAIKKLSATRVIWLSFGLLCLAVVLALGPLYLSSLLPTPETLSAIQRKLVGFTVVSAFNIAAICSVAATLLIASPDNARKDNLQRLIGPMLGALGLGAALAFSCGRIMANIQEPSIWAVLDDVLIPALALIISALVARQLTTEDLSSGRLSTSLAAGVFAFNYTLGFIEGYFEGFLEIILEILEVLKG